VIGKYGKFDAPDALLKGWKGLSPSVRAAVLDTLLSRAEWVSATLDALEKKSVLPAEVDAIRRQRLLEHKTDAVRKRAEKLFAASTNVARQKLVESYRPALAMKGDPAKGAAIFKRPAPRATCSPASARRSAPISPRRARNRARCCWSPSS